MRNKTRGFVITDWNVDKTQEDFDAIRADNDIEYVGYGLERCPTTGREHFQAFAYFISERSTSKNNLKKIGEMWGETRCNVLPMRGSFRQNELYCSKESDLIHSGIPPNQGARGDIRENIRLISERKLTADDIALLDPVSYNLYKKTYEKAEELANRNIYRQEMTQGIWYWGEAGTGKSHNAFENYDPKTTYVKSAEDWWDGYKGQEIVIINEFREDSGHKINWEYLMELTDKYPLNVKRRGREPTPFLAKKLIITSPEHPKVTFRKCISQGDNFKQLERRFKIIKMEKRSSTGNNRAVDSPEKVYIIKKKIKKNIEREYNIDVGIEEQLMLDLGVS